MQSKIVETLRREGFACAAERHLEDRGTFSFSEFGEDLIASLTREVAGDKPDAIAIYCTNFNGTRIAPTIERETGIPVLDSISLTLWQAIQLAGADVDRL